MPELADDGFGRPRRSPGRIQNSGVAEGLNSHPAILAHETARAALREDGAARPVSARRSEKVDGYPHSRGRLVGSAKCSRETALLRSTTTECDARWRTKAEVGRQEIPRRFGVTVTQ